MHNNNLAVKRIVDICMTVLLLCLMAYQVTGEAAHEYIGMGMTFLVIVHQILNRKWYGALFKGGYNLYRAITTAVNVLLILSFILTAFCGMSMSGYAVPFLYGMAKVSFVRVTHLALSGTADGISKLLQNRRKCHKTEDAGTSRIFFCAGIIKTVPRMPEKGADMIRCNCLNRRVKKTC